MNRQLFLKKYHKLLDFIFYSNYFYGICAVALSVEAMAQQHLPLNSLWYFFLVFMTTVLYYAYPYIKKSAHCNNPRTNWYNRNYTMMRWNQVVITIILSTALILFIIFQWKHLLSVTIIQWSAILIFPIIAALYYGLHSVFGKYNLRKTGWLKPFVIGFTWAGLVTVYPVFFYDIVNGFHSRLSQVNALLFLKNFMFISVLCIMFDIKDYATDYMNCLKTFIVKMGLRQTIFYLLFPLSIIGLMSFIYYAAMHQFNPLKIVLNVVPFVTLLVVVWSLHKRRPLMYYLTVVDGLMLVKAICGSIAMLYF
jgi:hypothetical protein